MATRNRKTGRDGPAAGRRESHDASPDERTRVAMFEVERRVYEDHLPEFLDSVGKFVLIFGGEIGGPFDTYAEALEAGYAKYGERPFLVKEISAVEPVQYFSRDLP